MTTAFAKITQRLRRISEPGNYMSEENMQQHTYILTYALLGKTSILHSSLVDATALPQKNKD